MNYKKITSAVLALSIVLTGITIPVLADDFKDISKNDRVYDSAVFLKNMGVIEGTSKDTFEPNKTVTRADFAVMIDRAAGEEYSEKFEYDDVPSDSYFAKAVSNATAAGIITGDDNGNFNPYAPITKQEAAVILTRAYEKSKDTSIFASSAASECSDYDGIDKWAKPYIDKAYIMGFIEPEDDNTIGAKTEFTRGDAAKGIAAVILSAENDTLPDTGKGDRIEQWQRGNIFVGDETPGFTVVTGNRTIEYVITDFSNTVVEHKTVSVAGERVDLEFPNYKPGYYEATIFASDNNGIKSEILKTSFCRLEDYDFSKVEDSPFGINMHCDRGSSGWKYDLLKEAYYMGVKHIRDGFEWAGVEGSKGNYTRMQSVINQLYDLTDQYDMSVLIVTGFANQFYDNNATPYTAEGLKGFANYSKSFYDLYGKDQAQEMYNEFWGFYRGDGPVKGQPEYYIPLLKETYETIKKEYPDAILSYCVGHSEWQGEPWRRNTFALGALKYSDVVNTHAYGPDGYEDISVEEDAHNWMKTLRDDIREYCPEKADIDIWNTETGGCTSTNKYGHSEETMAQFIPRISAANIADGVTRVYFYDFLDDGNTDSEHEDRFGLLHAFGSRNGDYTPKPSYVSYAALTRTLSNKKLVKNKSFENGIEWYTFSDGANDTHMLCTRGIPTKEAPLDTVIYADGPVTVTDMMGVKSTYTPVDGKLYMTLNGDVIYIEGKISDVKEESIVEFKMDEYIPQGERYNISSKSLNNAETEGMTIEADGNEYNIGDDMKISESYNSEARKVSLLLKKNGDVCGRLIVVTQSVAPYEATIDSGVETAENGGLQSFVKLGVTNKAPFDMEINNVVLNIDGKERQCDVKETVSCNETKDIHIVTGDADLGSKHEISARLNVDGVLSDKIDASGTFKYNAINRKTIVVDGVLDEGLDEVQVLDISKDGERFGLAMDGSKFNGESDFSGKIWITYDDENFYISAEVTDDEHNSPMTGETIWKNDSMQIDFVQLDTEGYNLLTGLTEIGISLLADNTTQLYCWSWAKDLGDREHPNGVKAVVTRDNAAKKTVYEAAVSWKEAGGIDVNNISRIDISIAFNDNDSGVRQNGFEIGGGVIYGKAPEKYNKYSLIR